MSESNTVKTALEKLDSAALDLQFLNPFIAKHADVKAKIENLGDEKSKIWEEAGEKARPIEDEISRLKTEEDASIVSRIPRANTVADSYRFCRNLSITGGATVSMPFIIALLNTVFVQPHNFLKAVEDVFYNITQKYPAVAGLYFTAVICTGLIVPLTYSHTRNFKKLMDGRSVKKYSDRVEAAAAYIKDQGIKE